MVQINFARREVNCKLVYYGPGLSGKTTNLEIIHKKAPDGAKGQLTSIATEQDRTLFFDFLPLDLGSVAGMKTKIFLYTVPGQVYYNSTRKLVLQGVDGLIFVADSGADRMNDNIESWKNLHENLEEYGLSLEKIPCIIQYNKRDLPGALSLDDLNKAINPDKKHPTTEAVAVKGDGVMLTLKMLAKIVIGKLNEEYAPRGGAKPAAAQKPAAPPAQKPAAPPPAPAKPQAAPAAAAAPAQRPAAAAQKPAPPTPRPAPPPPKKPVAPAPPPPVQKKPEPPAPPPRQKSAIPMAGQGGPPPKPAKKGKGGLIFLFIFLLLAAAGAAYYFLVWLPQNQ